MDDKPIVNRVAQSSLVQLDLEQYYHQGQRVVWDLKDCLYQQLILREQDFRQFIAEHDWTQYRDQNVAVSCSVDAIIPTWAYMLVAVHLQPHAHHVVFGDLNALEQSLFQRALHQIDLEQYRDAKVIIKGCSNYPVPAFAYVELVRLLMDYTQSIMYGEPCSTVPLYKRRKST